MPSNPSPSQLTQANFDLLSVINTGYLPETTLPLGVGTGGNDDFWSGFATILGNNGNDRIVGTGTLPQLINGGAGSDQIYGMGGVDEIQGGIGNDFIEGGAGGSAALKEVLNGGDGIDTLSYEHSPSGVTVDLRPGTGGNIVMATGGDATFDTVKATFENFVGSAFNDFVDGTNGVNVLFGLAGNDTIHGHQGNDTLVGGAGIDHLFGDEGDDILRGGAGADDLNGGAGIDTADYSTSTLGVTVNLSTGVGSGGDAQGDTYSEIQNVTGGSGNDTITGNSDINVLRGGAGNDTLTAIGLGELIGGAGADILTGGDFGSTFVYESLTDGGDTFYLGGGASRSCSLDLSQIDANSIAAGNQEFEYIGHNAFSENTPGQMRFFDQYVQVNVDNDTDAEFEIFLGTALPLGSSLDNYMHLIL